VNAKKFFWTGLFCLVITTLFSTWSLWTFRESQALRKSSSAMQAALDDVLESLQAADIAILMYQRSESRQELQRFALSYEAVQKELTILEAQYLTMKRQGYVDEPIEKAIQLLAILIQEKSGLLLGMVNRHQDPLDFENLSRLLEQDLATSQAIEGKIQVLDRLLSRQAQAHEAFLETNRNLMVTSNFLLMLASVALLAGGWWGLSQEIKRRIRVEGELRSAQEVAIRASRQKSDFLAAMSHEIRTPLNGILGLSEMMEREAKGEMKRRASVIHQSGQVLLRLVNEVLDLAKIEAGKLELEIERIQLSEVIESVCDLFASKAQEKELGLLANYDAPTEAWYALDGSRVSQIVNNLVGNAVKFTEKGSVEVSSRIRQKQDGFREWCFEVRDSGPGIEPQLRAKLFEQFRQGKDGKPGEGSGLGLSIAQSLAKKMGGEISYEAPSGGGSLFRLVIPVSLLEEAQSPPQLGSDLWIALGVRGIEFKVIEAAALRLGARCVAQELQGFDPGALKNAKAVFLGDPNVSGLAELIDKPLLFCGPTRLCPAGSRIIYPLTIGRIQRSFSVSEEGFSQTPLVPLEEGAKEERALSLPRLLLVEDNPTNQLLAEALLSKAGYGVTIAPDGETAVALAKAESFALILMDCRLPGIDGFEATKSIREMERANGRHRVSIVALTANLAITDRDRCLAAGMDDFLAKPFKRDELLSVVSKWTSESLIVDWSVLNDLASKTNTDLTNRLLAAFRSSLEKALESFRQQPKSADSLLYLAHQLKSSAASVGARAFSQRMGELEEKIEQKLEYSLVLDQALKEGDSLLRVLSSK
jgi:two-component system, sensor histidine kinase and response regulator